MKLKVFSIMIAAAISSGSALANTGTLTFSGAVSANTCTVSGMDQNINFTHLNRAAVQSLPNGRRIEVKNIQLIVENCPPAFTNANLTLNFAALPAAQNYMNFPDSTMRGVGVNLSQKTNETVGYDIEDGGVIIPIEAVLLRRTTGQGNAGSTVVTGEFNSAVSAQLVFE